MNYFK